VGRMQIPAHRRSESISDETPLQGRLSEYGSVGSPLPIVFEFSRVEVARGPQGTLFGAGSEAGTVRFITNEPNWREFGGYPHGKFGAMKYRAPRYETGLVQADGEIHELQK
jgi:iron complex outermembrane receptor protein